MEVLYKFFSLLTLYVLGTPFSLTDTFVWACVGVCRESIFLQKYSKWKKKHILVFHNVYIKQ